MTPEVYISCEPCVHIWQPRADCYRPRRIARHILSLFTYPAAISFDSAELADRSLACICVRFPLQRNYRGRLFRMLILNAGFVFRSIWQLISVVLPERTKSKIKLTSSNSDVSYFLIGGFSSAPPRRVLCSSEGRNQRFKLRLIFVMHQ